MNDRHLRLSNPSTLYKIGLGLLGLIGFTCASTVFFFLQFGPQSASVTSISSSSTPKEQSKSSKKKSKSSRRNAPKNASKSLNGVIITAPPVHKLSPEINQVALTASPTRETPQNGMNAIAPVDHSTLYSSLSPTTSQPSLNQTRPANPLISQ